MKHYTDVLKEGVIWFEFDNETEKQKKTIFTAVGDVIHFHVIHGQGRTHMGCEMGTGG